MFSNSAIASQCFTPSLSVKRDIDIYEELESTRLSESQYKQLKIFFKNLVGNWSGTATSLVCKGTLDAVEERITQFDAEVSIESDREKSRVDITSHLHSREERKRMQDILQLYLSPTRLGITERSKLGDLELINVAHNFLVYYRKFVTRVSGGGAVPREIIRSFAIYGRTVKMEYIQYSNGMLSEKMTWDLKK